MKKKIAEAFKEPFHNQKNIINLLTGGVLTLIPLVNLVPLGYLGTRLKKHIEQDKTSVKWDESIKNLFVRGFFLFLILLGYVIIPVLLMCLGGQFMLNLSGGRILSLFYFRGQILNLIATMMLLIALYFLPFAFCLYLEDNNIRMAFRFDRILDRIFKIPREYTILYVVIVALLAASAVAIFLFMNWLAGFLMSGFIFFYDGLVITNLLSKFFPRKAITISLLEVPE